MKNYTRADIIELSDRIYAEAGGKTRLMERICNYKKVTPVDGPIHNYYYVDKDVFDYGDLNATLSRAARFLDGKEGALAAGEDFVEILCTLADEGYLLDYTFCDKAFDGFAFQLFLHAWLIVKQCKSFDSICKAQEKEKIENWLYHRSKLMYRDKDAETWATFRPYDNQEIGVGACILAAELFSERDPELARGLTELADSRHLGWETKNGNPDDTLFYTPILAKVLYFYATYRKRPELLTSENCRQAFEGMLQQQPGAGIFTQYNWTQYGTAPEMMAMGANLFRDSRYKWLANLFLYERVEKRNERMQHTVRKLTPDNLDTLITGDNAEELRKIVAEELSRKNRYDHVWEGLADNVFHLWYFWDDDIEPVMPQEGSMVLEKSAGQGRWPYDPEPVLADKLVMRSGWNESDLFAIFNLWGGQNSPSSKTVSHRYPASNELISLVCGEQFVVSNTDQATRDVYIHRSELNAFSLRREGKWVSPPLVMYNPEGKTFGIYPTLEDTYNSELRYFESYPSADSGKFTLYEYYGWINERTVMHCTGEFLAVFDQSFGPTAEEGGVRWHLKGDVIHRTEDSMTLSLLQSKLKLLYPHDPSWFTVEETKNERAIAVYQHQSDIDLDFVATGRRMGFVTVFCPENSAAPSAEIIKVTCAGHPAHPSAMGIKVGTKILGSRLGMYRDEYDYDGIKTDAGSFMFEQTADGCKVTIFDAKTLRIETDSFDSVKASDELLSAMSVNYKGNLLAIRFKSAISGELTIKY